MVYDDIVSRRYSAWTTTILALVALAHPSPPAEGLQIGRPSVGWDVRFPLTITQCEPVFMYYNNTDYPDGGVSFITLDGRYFLFIGPFQSESATLSGYATSLLYDEWASG